MSSTEMELEESKAAFGRSQEGHRATAPDVIDIKGLTKVFGSGGSGATALQDVDLRVTRGEFLVLIGLSGAGKSTLLRCINGLVRPTSGSVEVLGTRVDGAELKELRKLRRRVGFIFQHFNLVGRLTALENVLSGALGRLSGPRYGIISYPKDLREEAMHQLERVRLSRIAFQRADTLSGGEQQRVAIARTLLQEPEIVLADEPVASLDPESSGDVMNLLFEVCAEEGLSVVCSLHQLELALGWAHRLVGMKEGRVVLNEPARGLTADEAMKVYSRVESGNNGERGSSRARHEAEKRE